MASNNPFADAAASPPRAPRSATSSEDLETLGAAVNQPLPYESESHRGSTLLSVPVTGAQTPNRASGFFAAGQDTPRESVVDRPQSTAADSALLLADNDEKRASALSTGAGLGALGADAGSEEVVPDKEQSGMVTAVSGTPARRRRRLLLLAGIALLIIAIAVAVPVGVVVGRKNSNNAVNGSSGGSGGSGGGSGGSGSNGPTTGGDGSTVTTEDGQTFTYTNKLGGFWVDDPKDPFNNNAQAQSYTPPLNTSWTWGTDRCYGVNLGGWLVLEPFIAPALYQKYQNLSFTVQDEWTLSVAMINDTSSTGGLQQLEDHYNTFITEQDIAEIAGAGLNFVRVPIPYWAVDVWDNEPFLAKTSWKYLLRLFRWCRKYGIRINLDLHTIPGSQNGFNHSGKLTNVNFMATSMGYANAQRTLDYIRIITEFISQPQYQNLVPVWGIINEPLVGLIGKDQMIHFYYQAHQLIRSITGYGEGNGAYISIHDGFQSQAEWVNFLPGADRFILDTHPYIAFNGQPNLEPIGTWPARACNTWGPLMNQSSEQFGVSIAGEFSNAINDCGLWVNGVGSGANSYGGDCSYWMDHTQWNQTIKDGLKQFALASMDALQNWFFWTWKIGNASNTSTVQSPLWSYQLGLENGWMPTDPREAIGVCNSLGVNGPDFDGQYESWQTGGAGAGTVSASAVQSYDAWPPTSLAGVTGDYAFLYTYTPTGTVSTLPADTFTAAAKSVSQGDGWFDTKDTSSAYTEVAGCTYSNPWGAAGTLPTTTCDGSAATAARLAVRMAVTPPPEL